MSTPPALRYASPIVRPRKPWWGTRSVLVAIVLIAGGLAGTLPLASTIGVHSGGRTIPGSSVGASIEPSKSVSKAILTSIHDPERTSSIPVGSEPAGAVWDNVNGYIYILNYGSDNVSVIDGTTVVTSIPVGSQPDAAVVDADNGYVYVLNHNSGSVSVIDGTSVVTTIPVGIEPYAAAFDPANGYVYVANWGTGNVSVIDGTTSVASIRVGEAPSSATVDPDNGYVYVANWNSDNVSVIDGTTIVASIPIGEMPFGAVFAADTGYVYFANEGSDNVSVVDGLSVIGSIPVGSEPLGGVFDSNNGDAYFYNWLSTNVSVIHGTSFVRSITVGAGPDGAAFDSDNGYVYVDNGGPSADNVTVLNGTSIIESIPVGKNPSGAVFDSANGNIYVCNYGSANVSVINGSSFYPSISSFSVTPSIVEIGSATIPTATLTVTARKGGGPSTYTYAGLPVGCITRNASTLNCTPSVSGTYAVRVYVNDSVGDSATATSTLLVVAALTTSPTAVLNPTDAGISVSFDSNSSGGISPKTYAWQFGDGGSSTAQNPSHSYAFPGNFTARVWVNDSGGGSANHTLLISVDPTLKVVLSVSNATPVLGQSIAINASASGGAAPYSYAYAGFPPGCVTVSSPTIGCLPTQAGFYNLSVVVTDRNGVSTNATIPIEVVFDFTVAVPSVDTVGHAFTLSVKPEGGYGALTFGYTGLPPGCSSADSPQLTCTPTRVGDYTISISVHDEYGNRASSQVKVEVIAAGALSAWSFFESPIVLGGIVGAALVVILAAAVLYSRNRGLGGSASNLYAAYQLPKTTESDAGPFETDSSRPESRMSASNESGSSVSEEDPLSDLI